MGLGQRAAERLSEMTLVRESGCLRYLPDSELWTTREFLGSIHLAAQ